MAEVIIEVDCDQALYPKVNGTLGLDPNTGVAQPKRMEWLSLLGKANP